MKKNGFSEQYADVIVNELLDLRLGDALSINTDEDDLELDRERRIYHVTSEDGVAKVEETNRGTEPVLKEPEEPDFS